MTTQSENEPQKKKQIDPEIIREQKRKIAGDLFGDGIEEEYTFERDPIDWSEFDSFSGPDEKSEKPTYEPTTEPTPKSLGEKIGPDTPNVVGGGKRKEDVQKGIEYVRNKAKRLRRRGFNK